MLHISNAFGKACLLLFLLTLYCGYRSHANAQNWPVEVLRSKIVGAATKAADFNNDGVADMLVQNGDTLFWYENHRPGWTPHIIDTQFRNSWFDEVEIFDMDLDGDIDVLQIPTSVDQVTVAMNENRQNGMEWVRHEIAIDLSVPGNAIGSYGDLDGDADIDVALALPSMGKLIWLENSATVPWPQHDVATHSGVTWSTVADIDGDGDLDIAAADFNTSGNILWYENQLPDSSWTTRSIAGQAGTVFADCEDIDGDGDQDLIVSNFLTRAIVYYENPSWRMVSILSGVPGLVLGALGDVDGDSNMDVTFGGIGGVAGDIGWLENSGSSSGWQKHVIDASTVLQRFPTGLADIDGDGDIDFTALTFNGDTFIGDARWYSNTSTTTAIDEKAGVEVPSKFRLAQNHPNPFWSGATSRFAGNPSTIIRYEIPRATQVNLAIYNLLGEKIRTLVDTQESAGIKQVTWDGRDERGQHVSSGVYLYRLEAGEFTMMRRLVVMR